MNRQGYYSPQRGYWEVVGRVTEKLLVQFPDDTIEVPLRPNTYSFWRDGVWVENENVKYHYFADIVRAERNEKLAKEVDPLVTNPLRWNDLTESQKTNISEYRRQLLDISNQPGFPYNVAWPTLNM